MADEFLNLSGLNIDASLDEILQDVFTNVAPFYPPALVLDNGQNILVNDLGGPFFNFLREHVPNWYRVVSNAYIAMYSWHGTVDARPLCQSLVQTLISQAYDLLALVDSNWSVENVPILINNELRVTSFDDKPFMKALKEVIVAAGTAFYNRTLIVVCHLLLPSDTAPWQHPGIIPAPALDSLEQIDYVKSLVAWNPCTGYSLWHDLRPNENGEMRLYWFDQHSHSLKHLMDIAHFAIGSPGYLYIQELYPNVETGGEEWGPLNTITFYSMTWILTAVHVYLWANILGNKQFATNDVMLARRDAILDTQNKISIFLKQILHKRVPGLTAQQNEDTYIALHRFMHTNHNLPFLI